MLLQREQIRPLRLLLRLLTGYAIALAAWLALSDAYGHLLAEASGAILPRLDPLGHFIDARYESARLVMTLHSELLDKQLEWSILARQVHYGFVIYAALFFVTWRWDRKTVLGFFLGAGLLAAFQVITVYFVIADQTTVAERHVFGLSERWDWTISRVAAALRSSLAHQAVAVLMWLACAGAPLRWCVSSGHVASQRAPRIVMATERLGGASSWT